MTLVRDNMPGNLDVVEPGFETTFIECEDEQEVCYEATIERILGLCEFASAFTDGDIDRIVLKPFLADIKELLDVADRFCDREISKQQLQMRKVYGGYDKMLLMEVPNEDDDEYDDPVDGRFE